MTLKNGWSENPKEWLVIDPFLFRIGRRLQVNRGFPLALRRPSTVLQDVLAAIDDMEQLYASCDWQGRLAERPGVMWRWLTWIWVNYNDLTRPNSPQMVVYVGNSPPTILFQVAEIL